MFSILLVSHGELAKEFLNTCEFIAGEQKNIAAVGLYPDESRECFQKKIADAAEGLHKEDGLLVLADLYGGSPCTVSILEFINKYEKVEILTGLNLSMLLEVIINRENMHEAVDSILATGKSGIINIRSQMLLKCNE